MMVQHRELAAGKWFGLSLTEQIANIGSEATRAIVAKQKGDALDKSIERLLELISFTIKDLKNKKRLKEITRMKEVLLDYLSGPNLHQTTPKIWQKYFYPFAYLSRSKNLPNY